MNPTIKTLMKNTFTTTGITLVLLSVIAKIMGGSVLFLETVYQSLLANFLIHIGLQFVGKLETPYRMLDFLIQLAYYLFVTITCGYLFHWYSSTPMWIVILMTIVIVITGGFLDAMKINHDVEIINRHLSMRKGER